MKRQNRVVSWMLGLALIAPSAVWASASTVRPDQDKDYNSGYSQPQTVASDTETGANKQGPWGPGPGAPRPRPDDPSPWGPWGPGPGPNPPAPGPNGPWGPGPGPSPWGPGPQPAPGPWGPGPRGAASLSADTPIGDLAAFPSV